MREAKLPERLSSSVFILRKQENEGKEQLNLTYVTNSRCLNLLHKPDIVTLPTTLCHLLFPTAAA